MGIKLYVCMLEHHCAFYLCFAAGKKVANNGLQIIKGFLPTIAIFYSLFKLTFKD